jgi:hypothetical protein
MREGTACERGVKICRNYIAPSPRSQLDGHAQNESRNQSPGGAGDNGRSTGQKMLTDRLRCSIFNPAGNLSSVMGARVCGKRDAAGRS